MPAFQLQRPHNLLKQCTEDPARLDLFVPVPGEVCTRLEPAERSHAVSETQLAAPGMAPHIDPHALGMRAGESARDTVALIVGPRRPTNVTPSVDPGNSDSGRVGAHLRAFENAHRCPEITCLPDHALGPHRPSAESIPYVPLHGGAGKRALRL